MPSTGEITRCDHCGSITSKRKIALSVGIVRTLGTVYRWARERGIHEFTMKDIRDLLDHTGYARFGDLVYFGGLVYKQGKAHYGLNMERCEEFFRGEGTIPPFVWRDPTSGEITYESRVTIKDIPHMSEMLDEQGLYIVEYKR